MLENKRSRVYCFSAVRSSHRSSRSAPKTRSREARTMTEMGLFCTNRSNTSPSMAASLMTKLKKAYRIQDRHTLTPLGDDSIDFDRYFIDSPFLHEWNIFSEQERGI